MSSLKYADFKGPAKQLEDLDLPRIAHEIGCGEDEVHMLMDVESAGDGFDSQGRPKMLFEPHIFYRELVKRKLTKQLDAAMKAGVAYKVWRTKPYPKDSYPNLQKAIAINPEVALMSASWGAEQMMGFNYKTAGFADVFTMINAHCEDEENHIRAMINFCTENDLADDLQRLAALKRPTTAADCAPIARVYNGASYAENKYDQKLAAAHNKWRGIKDTPWTPDAAEGPIISVPTPGAVLENGLSVANIREIQQLLRDKGYVEVGNVDGDIGKNTISAVSAFQIAQGLPVTGKVDQVLWDQLKVAPMRPVSVERANAGIKDLEAQNVPAAKENKLIKQIGTALTTVSGIGLILDGDIGGLDKALTAVNKFQAIGAALGDMLPWAIGLGGGGAALYFGSKALSHQIEGFRKGTVR